MTILSDTLDCRDGFPLYLDAQHKARIDQHTIHDHVARATIAVIAALLRPGKPERVAQHLEQTLTRLAQEFDLITIDLRLHMDFRQPPYLSYKFSLARWLAVCKARRVNTAARCLRCATVPRTSRIGVANCAAI